MSAKKPPITRVRIAREELEKMSNDDFLKCWTLQEQYIDHLEKTLSTNTEHSELLSLRESEEKLRQQQLDATRRENILVMRLTTKEQEMQEFAGQIQELKQAQVPSIAQLRSALLDPAVNLLFERMRKEMDSLKARLEETQNELNAWKFTPDSNTGKRLMAKCRLLYQENEELGKIISSGRMAKLEGDLALQKSFSEEMKKSQSELDEFLLELDEDVEGMQSTIYYLQQQLRESKDQISTLQKEKQKLSGMPNGSPSNHRLVPNEAMETDIPSPRMLPISVQKDIELDLSKPERTEAVNGKEPVQSVLMKLKIEAPPSPATNEVTEQIVPETPKKVHETSVILSASDIKPEISKTCNNLPESNVHSVIVENKTVIANPEKQAPLVERTNILVDGIEATPEIALRTNEPVEETIATEEATHNSTKRTPEGAGGRGRKRTRARAALEPEEEKEAPLPVRKRTRRTREATNAEKKQASLEIDTDTEVQVAQTLAYWASANKERTEVKADPSCSLLGNGEIVKKDHGDK